MATHCRNLERAQSLRSINERLPDYPAEGQILVNRDHIPTESPARSASLNLPIPPPLRWGISALDRKNISGVTYRKPGPDRVTSQFLALATIRLCTL